jgi:hypothetical protein
MHTIRGGVGTLPDSSSKALVCGELCGSIPLSMSKVAGGHGKRSEGKCVV